MSVGVSVVNFLMLRFTYVKPPYSSLRSSPRRFVYDPLFGGVVTRDGILDSASDFGNGWYNDHHYHYGYIIQAAALVSTIDEGGEEFTNRFGAMVDSLFYDVCSNQPSNQEVRIAGGGAAGKGKYTAYSRN